MCLKLVLHQMGDDGAGDDLILNCQYMNMEHQDINPPAIASLEGEEGIPSTSGFNRIDTVSSSDSTCSSYTSSSSSNSISSSSDDESEQCKSNQVL